MASRILETVLEIDNGDGTTTRLPGVTTKVWSVTGAADVATVVTDSDGFFPETTVAGAVGSAYIIRIENYQGRAGCLDVVSVA